MNPTIINRPELNITELSKTILMVMPNAFEYGWMGSTSRIIVIANSFKKLGYNVVLLTRMYINKSVQEEIDFCFPGMILRTYHYGAYPSLIDKYSLLRRMWRILWRIQGQSKYWQNISFGWANILQPQAIKLTLEAFSCDVKLIWGISAGLLEGGVAASLLASELKVPWIYELHDPPLHAGLGVTINGIEECFSELLTDANLVVPNTKAYQDLLIKKWKLKSERSFLMYFTFEESIQEIKPDSRDPHKDKWKMGHYGSLAGDRSINPILEALHLAIHENPLIKDKVIIELAGYGDNYTKALKLGEKLQLDGNIRYLGFLSKGEVDVRSSNCDAIIIVQPPENNLEIPGKLFNAIRTKRPIIGLMETTSESASILTNSGLGFISDAQNIEVIKNIIQSLWHNWYNEMPSCKPNDEYINTFSPVQTIHSLNRICEKVL
jgi:hypothetical protein